MQPVNLQWRHEQKSAGAQAQFPWECWCLPCDLSGWSQPWLIEIWRHRKQLPLVLKRNQNFTKWQPVASKIASAWIQIWNLGFEKLQLVPPGAGTQFLKRPSLPCRVKLSVFGCLGMPWRLPKQYHLSQETGVSSGDDINDMTCPQVMDYFDVFKSVDPNLLLWGVPSAVFFLVLVTATVASSINSGSLIGGYSKDDGRSLGARGEHGATIGLRWCQSRPMTKSWRGEDGSGLDAGETGGQLCQLCKGYEVHIRFICDKDSGFERQRYISWIWGFIWDAKSTGNHG